MTVSSPRATSRTSSGVRRRLADEADLPRVQRLHRAFLISCGGTGGHLAPGIALAEELVGRRHRVTLLISEKKVDAQLAAKYPWLNFVPLPGAPFGLSPSVATRFAAEQARGFGVAWDLVKEMQPDLVIGFGGFTSAAVMLVAGIFRVPIALHEANQVPGRAIRLMAPLATRLYLPPGVEMGANFTSRVRPVGLPVRPEIHREPREAACRVWGLDPARPVVAVLGGSQGARALNEWAARAARELAAAGVQLLCVTGSSAKQPEVHLAEGGLRAVFLPFCDRMATLLSAADLVVSRAGAGTIAELVRCGTPAILVPYPFAADNHQAANAASFAASGGGVVVSQENTTELTPLVLRTLRTPGLLESYRESLQRAQAVDPRQVIAADLEHLVQERRRTFEPVTGGVAA